MEMMTYDRSMDRVVRTGRDRLYRLLRDCDGAVRWRSIAIARKYGVCPELANTTQSEVMMEW